jgi:hypothetical protein
MQGRTLNINDSGMTPALLTHMAALHGSDWFADNIDQILKSGFVSSGSCTSNGCVTGLVVMAVALTMTLERVEVVPEDFSEVQAMVVRGLRLMTYSVINMQHGATNDEDRSVAAYLRMVPSGASNEVPMVLAEFLR